MDAEQRVDLEAGAAAFDSSGVWTVDGRRGRQQPRLPRRGDWVLKVVQAAVAVGVAAIRVRSRGLRAEFRFENGQPWDLDGLLTALRGEAGGPLQGGEEHLWLALAAVEGSFTLCDAGRELSRTEGRLELRGCRSGERRLVVSGAAPAPDDLLLRLRACPLSMLWNGQPLAGALDAPAPECQRVALLFGSCQSPPLGALRIPPGLPKAGTPDGCALAGVVSLHASAPTYQNLPIWIGSAPYTQMPSSLGLASQVHWVLDGVTLEPAAELGVDEVACELFVSAAGLRTDLSGLQLGTGQQEAAQRIGSACRAARALLSFPPPAGLPLDEVTARSADSFDTTFQHGVPTMLLVSVGVSLATGTAMLAALTFVGALGLVVQRGSLRRSALTRAERLHSTELRQRAQLWQQLEPLRQMLSSWG